ncbi:BTB/POZ protein [Ochromonadaceae sp. CCMP2298]|nr:BTB/POZ protein [Ochromonadaceae sp. CCMP2298]
MSSSGSESTQDKAERLAWVNKFVQLPSDHEYERTEVQILEQASLDADEDIQRLVLKHEKIKAATDTSTDKAKTESEIILRDAKTQAESIEAQSQEIMLYARNEADSILAWAAEEIYRWEAEKTALAGVQLFEPNMKLDVGGVRLRTSLTTLNRFPDSMIGCMFSGRHALPKGEDGYFFIDRDGTHFRHILNFLRSPEGYKVLVTGAEEEELRRECEFNVKSMALDVFSPAVDAFFVEEAPPQRVDTDEIL